MADDTPELTIRWDEVDGAEEYAVFVSGTGSLDDAEQVAGSPTSFTEITVAAPEVPGMYSYFVTARASGLEEATSAAFSVDVGDVYPPTAPTDLTFNASGLLTWTPSIDNVEVVQYVVSRDGLTATVYGPSYAAATLPPGRYIYTVTAWDAENNESVAATVERVIPASIALISLAKIDGGATSAPSADDAS